MGKIRTTGNFSQKSKLLETLEHKISWKIIEFCPKSKIFDKKSGIVEKNRNFRKN